MHAVRVRSLAAGDAGPVCLLQLMRLKENAPHKDEYNSAVVRKTVQDLFHEPLSHRNLCNIYL